jgi:pyoverdine/dityrosine biosynthesis protein Dit1
MQWKGVTQTRRQSSVATQRGPAMSISEQANEALKVLNRYRTGYQNDWDLPQSLLDSRERIETYIRRGKPIELVLPAFPFKSSNRTKKVLGPLPDEAERISLLHLSGLCEAIKDATSHRAQLVIVSDGLCYNGTLLGVE